MRIVNEEVDREQVRTSALSRHDRRLLLSATLESLLHRVRHHSPVLMSELTRLVALADDAEDGA